MTEDAFEIQKIVEAWLELHLRTVKVNSWSVERMLADVRNATDKVIKDRMEPLLALVEKMASITSAPMEGWAREARETLRQCELMQPKVEVKAPEEWGMLPVPLMSAWRVDGEELIDQFTDGRPCRYLVIRDEGDRWIALVEAEDQDGERYADLIASLPTLLCIDDVGRTGDWVAQSDRWLRTMWLALEDRGNALEPWFVPLKVAYAYLRRALSKLHGEPDPKRITK